MIRAGFLSREERAALTELARDGSVTHRLARRATALVLLDDGMSCEQVGKVLLLDDDTIRRWHGAFAQGGRKALIPRLDDRDRSSLLGKARSASAPLRGMSATSRAHRETVLFVSTLAAALVV